MLKQKINIMSSVVVDDKKKYKNIKRSVGILLFNHKLDKVLLVQKKCTYAYSEFVTGKYDKHDKNSLLEKFNKMTSNEKMIIWSLEFEWIWYNMFTCREKNDMYCRAFGRFYKCFLNNNKMLRILLNQSNKNGNLIWEPPKGRKNKTESSLKCAIREVYEETKIKATSYQLIPGKKIKKQLISNNIRYIIIYYIGIMKEDESVRLNVLDKQQSSEISDIGWVPISNLSQYNMLNDIRQSVISSCKHIKKDINNSFSVEYV